MKNILDWIYKNNNEIIIWSTETLQINSFKKEDLLYFHNKWLDFSLLRKLYNLYSELEMYYYQDKSLILETYYTYKDICDKNWIEINYFVNIDEFFKNMDNKNHWTSDTKKSIKWYIYIIKSWDFYKIWKTTNLKNRIKKYITENPNEIELIHSFESNDYSRQELELHYKFKNKNHNREWFILEESDILFLKTL